MFKIGNYKVDQMALFVPDIKKAITAYERNGHPFEVLDTVRANNSFVDNFILNNKLMPGIEFVVDLAFNYTILPIEFELISLKSGMTAQLIDKEGVGLSHFGFHVEILNKAIDDFESMGFHLLSIINTLSHSASNRLYKYAFVDTRSLGFISKLIMRMR